MRPDIEAIEKRCNKLSENYEIAHILPDFMFIVGPALSHKIALLDVPALLAYIKELEEKISNRRNGFYQYWGVYVVGQKSFNPVAVFEYYDQAEKWARHTYRVECKIELFGLWNQKPFQLGGPDEA